MTIATTEPVLVHGTVATISAAIAPILVAAGLSSTGSGEWGSIIGAVAFALLSLYHLWQARSKVTPTVKIPTAISSVMSEIDTLERAGLVQRIGPAAEWAKVAAVTAALGAARDPIEAALGTATESMPAPATAQTKTIAGVVESATPAG